MVTHKHLRKRHLWVEVAEPPLWGRGQNWGDSWDMDVGAI